jgi:hypothetical protein
MLSVIRGFTFAWSVGIRLSFQLIEDLWRRQIDDLSVAPDGHGPAEQGVLAERIPDSQADRP